MDAQSDGLALHNGTHAIQYGNIDQADPEMCIRDRLFQQRMEVSKQIAAYKQQHQLPILDSARAVSYTHLDVYKRQ